jgi:hypothetical protein
MDIRGTLVAFRGDSIQVLENGGSVAVIPLSRVQSVRVSDGRDRWRGAQYGALFGVGFGLLMSLVPPECDGNGYGYDCRRDGSSPTVSQYIWENVEMGLWVGILTGAAVGTERWRPVIAMRPVTTRSTSSGFKLGLSRKF